MRVALLEGQTLGQYQLREPLGQGGMGTVYRGYQANLKREVAVKVLPDDLADEPGYIERFNREAEIAAALEHPNIVPILDYGTQRHISYVVMRLLTGGTLSQRLRQKVKSGGNLPSLGEVSRLLNQLASALDYAHSKNVIHRDIKPNNVMFDNHGHPYLVDFGIAKLLEGTAQLTGTGMTMGTPAYMPPEQWKAEKITPAADQYALGAMIYELVTGRVPFTADTPFALMNKHINEQPTPPQAWRGDVPDAVNIVLERAMAKEATDRFPNVTSFAQAFERAIQGVSSGDTNFFTAKLPALETRPRNTKPTLLPDVETARTPTGGGEVIHRPRTLQNIAIAVLLVLVLGLIGYETYDQFADDELVNSPTADVVNAPTTPPVGATTQLTPSIVSSNNSPVPTDFSTTVQTLSDVESTPLSQPTATLIETQIAPAMTAGVSNPTVAKATEALPTTMPSPTTSLALVTQTMASPFATVVDVVRTDDNSEGLDRRYYDSFDSEGNPNESRWNLVYGGDDCSFNQSDGILTIHAEAGDSEKCVLEMNNLPYSEVSDFGSVTASFKLTDSPEGHQSSQGILLTNADQTWFVYCGLDTRDYGGGVAHQFFRMDGVDEESDFAVEAKFDEWYTYRLSFDPATQTFSCLVNDNPIGEPFGVGNSGEFEKMTDFRVQIETLRQDKSIHALSFVDNVSIEPSFLYDNFTDRQSEGGWSTDRWASLTETNTQDCHPAQEKGVFKFKSQTGDDVRPPCIWGIKNPTSVSKDQLMMVGAEIYLPNVPENTIYPVDTMLTVLGDDLNPNWKVQCGTHVSSGSPVAQFMIYGDGEPLVLGDEYPLIYNEWYTYRLIFYPDTYTFDCYMNGEWIGSGTPFDQHPTSFALGIEIAGEPEPERLYGYITNFRLHLLDGLNPTATPSPIRLATTVVPPTSTATPTRTSTSTPTPSNTPRPVEPSRTPTPSNTPPMVLPSRTPTPSPTLSR